MERKRINKKGCYYNDPVWIGFPATILKGSQIEDNYIRCLYKSFRIKSAIQLYFGSKYAKIIKFNIN